MYIETNFLKVVSQISCVSKCVDKPNAPVLPLKGPELGFSTTSDDRDKFRFRTWSLKRTQLKTQVVKFYVK